MKSKSTKLIYILSFLVSFFLFLFLTFPFEVLKETIAQKISQVSGLSVSMESLSPNLPLGINSEGVSIARPGGKKAKIDEIDIDFKFFALFTGNLGIGLEIEDNKGNLELDVSIPISGLLANNLLPAFLEFQTEKFNLTELIGFGLDYYANSASVNPLIGPLLKQLSLKGAVTSSVKIDLDTKDPKSSEGNANIKFSGLSMASTDKSLGIPMQKFKTAQFIAKLSAGDFKVDPRSKFVSDQLGISLSGTVGLKNPISRSNLKMDVGMDLSGEIKENIGSLIAMLLLKTDSSTWNGKATMQLSGTLGIPNVNPLLEK